MAGERGSVLMLMPALLLVTVLLGSIAVDTAVVFLAERELAALAAAAANDAATAGVDQAHLRDTGEFRLDGDTVRAVVQTTLARSSSSVEVATADARIEQRDGRPAVRVTLHARADYVIARGLPGAPDGRTVAATAVAVAALP